LNHFGEGPTESGGSGRIRVGSPKTYAGLNASQIALSTMGRVNQRLGMGYVVEVIRGANNQRIRDFGHDNLKVYGMGREKSHEHWVTVIRQLSHPGLAMQNAAQHSSLPLTDSPRPLPRADVPLNVAVPTI
ncbi:RQC domain-containing protein, partial [Salmonella enterica]|uniref:RQC domain-containing protein n=1 Tax=Salmonella enterica TaxID=28901 RepID=UPI00398C3160